MGLTLPIRIGISCIAMNAWPAGRTRWIPTSSQSTKTFKECWTSAAQMVASSKLELRRGRTSARGRTVANSVLIPLALVGRRISDSSGRNSQLGLGVPGTKGTVNSRKQRRGTTEAVIVSSLSIGVLLVEGSVGKIVQVSVQLRRTASQPLLPISDRCRFLQLQVHIVMIARTTERGPNTPSMAAGLATDAGRDRPVA